MEPVWTLPYAEYCVALQLQRAFPQSRGYTVFAPMSRQERGVDLVLARRARGHTRVATTQVKSSRTYSRPKATDRTKKPLRYYTWFNNFDFPDQADFCVLVALYPAVDAAQRRELGTWWAPQLLLFTRAEMRRFLRSVKTVKGKRDRMFGFGFNEPTEVFQTRGDSRRRYRDYSRFLLARRLVLLRRRLAR
jgi:hypothetical protein